MQGMVGHTQQQRGCRAWWYHHIVLAHNNRECYGIFLQHGGYTMGWKGKLSEGCPRTIDAFTFLRGVHLPEREPEPSFLSRQQNTQYIGQSEKNARTANYHFEDPACQGQCR